MLQVQGGEQQKGHGVVHAVAAELAHSPTDHVLQGLIIAQAALLVKRRGQGQAAKQELGPAAEANYNVYHLGGPSARPDCLGCTMATDTSQKAEEQLQRALPRNFVANVFDGAFF